MIKSFVTLLFSRSIYARYCALKELFPTTMATQAWEPPFAYSKDVIGVAGEEIKRGDVVSYDLNGGPDQKIYKADTIHQSDTSGFSETITWGADGSAAKTVRADDKSLIDFAHMLGLDDDAAEEARLCFRYPEYAVAKAKYEQAQRNSKKSSGFKAEMEAIRAKDAGNE